MSEWREKNEGKKEQRCMYIILINNAGIIWQKKTSFEIDSSAKTVQNKRIKDKFQRKRMNDEKREKRIEARKMNRKTKLIHWKH